MAEINFTVSPMTVEYGDDVIVTILGIDYYHDEHTYYASLGHFDSQDDFYLDVVNDKNPSESIFEPDTDYLEIRVYTNNIRNFTGRSMYFFVGVWRDDEDEWKRISGGSGRPPHIYGQQVYVVKRSPEIGSITVSPVQPEDLSPDFANEYISTVTRARIMASASVYSDSPSGNVVSLTWTGNRNPITQVFSGTSFSIDMTTTEIAAQDSSGTVRIDIAVTDSHGRRNTNYKILSFLPYTKPYVEVQELGRCDAQGLLQEDGAYYRLNAFAQYFTELEGNALTKFTSCLNGQSTPDNLTSGVTSILGGSMEATLAYTVTVIIQDRVTGEQRREFRLAGKLRDFVLRRYGHTSHLGIGCTPTPQNGASSIQLPTNGKLIIGGQDIIAALLARIEALENGG